VQPLLNTVRGRKCKNNGRRGKREGGEGSEEERNVFVVDVALHMWEEDLLNNKTFGAGTLHVEWFTRYLPPC